MTPLRAKYIRDLAIRGRAARTQQSYTSYVADLARYYRRSPDQISYEEVADWLHHLIRERHHSASSVNIAVIRHYGILGNNRRKRDVPKARALLHRAAKRPAQSIAPRQVDPLRCPHCGRAGLRWVGWLDAYGMRHSARWKPPLLDSS